MSDSKDDRLSVAASLPTFKADGKSWISISFIPWIGCVALGGWIVIQYVNFTRDIEELKDWKRNIVPRLIESNSLRINKLESDGILAGATSVENRHNIDNIGGRVGDLERRINSGEFREDGRRRDGKDGVQR